MVVALISRTVLSMQGSFYYRKRLSSIHAAVHREPRITDSCGADHCAHVAAAAQPGGPVGWTSAQRDGVRQGLRASRVGWAGARGGTSVVRRLSCSM